jgi:transforming growth factor-beta-induced protein
VHISPSGIKINSAPVQQADVLACNGVVHVIGAVLMPPASPPAPLAHPCKDIVALAQCFEALSTLVTAVVAGGLVDTLKGPGPFTVFAPTNKAFAALPDGTLASLLKPENKAQLADILTYHVLPAKVLSTDLKNGETAKTVEGKSVAVRIERFFGREIIEVNRARVIEADVLACNGVVHVIDAVLLPPTTPTPPPAPACKDIVALAQSVKDLSTLVTAVVAGGLVDTLKGPGPFTVFAPTNEAFAALPNGTLVTLLKPENKAQLDDILTYHVLPAKVLSTDLKNGETAKTVEGKSVTVHISPSGIKINSAPVQQADVLACNGVVHVIGAVLIPPTA